MNDDDDASTELTIPSASVLHLLGAHLTECGLHQTCTALQRESGVGLVASPHPPTAWYQWAVQGQWGQILEALRPLDNVKKSVVAAVYEMTILELAEQSEWDVAYATFRMVQRELELVPASSSDDSSGISMNVARLLEQKLAALASAKKIPKDYYGDDSSRQERREQIGRQLQGCIPQQPKNRLRQLLQQSIKWQSYTGKLPQRRVEDDDDDAEPKKKKRKRKKEFDLVLGSVERDHDPLSKISQKSETVPADPYATVKFGKKATAESAVFLPDGSGLVTGSSDGLIEIWDAAQQYSELRLDLPYQQNDQLLGHNDVPVTALAVSRDGTLLASAGGSEVQIWRLDTGKSLRRLKNTSSILSLEFSADGSRVLVGGSDGTCREFGLRTARQLQEFRGHSLYVASCAYVTITQEEEALQSVVTGSGDGTLRLWHGKTAELLRTLRPSTDAKNLVVDHHEITTDSPALVAVLPLHTPPQSFVVVNRSTNACCVDASGEVLCRYIGKEIFVAATVSTSNRTLYAVQEDGVCCVFDIETGELRQTIRDFGSETVRSEKAEISALLHHPSKTILAAFSNDKGQKKGQLVLWK